MTHYYLSIHHSRLFKLLIAKVQELDCKLKHAHIMLDFELAVYNVLSLLFPECHIKGCLSHHSQALWRKLQQLGLCTYYKNDGNVRDWFRMLLRLPFVPVEHVHQAFTVIITCHTPSKLPSELVHAFYSYYESTWLNGSICVLLSVNDYYLLVC